MYTRIKARLQAWKCGKCINSKIFPVGDFDKIFWHLLNCKSSVNIVLAQAPCITQFGRRMLNWMPGQILQRQSSRDNDMNDSAEWAAIYRSSFNCWFHSTFGEIEGWDVITPFGFAKGVERIQIRQSEMTEEEQLLASLYSSKIYLCLNMNEKWKLPNKIL